MGKLISLDEHRPHLSGQALCLVCGYEWIAVAPVGIMHLECPKCERIQGVIKNAIEPSGEQSYYQCNCGESMFFALAMGWLLCRKCGNTFWPWTDVDPPA